MSHIHGAVAAVSDAESKELVAVSVAQSELLAQSVGLGITLSNAMSAIPGFIPCGHAFSELFLGLKFSFGEAALSEVEAVTEGVRARAEHVSNHRGVEQGKPFDLMVSMRADGATAGKLAQLMASLHVLASLAERAQRLGVTNDELNKTVAESLALTAKSKVQCEEFAKAADRVAQFIPVALQMLQPTE
ncbi:hypothetical protein [Atopobium fossor]|uniref:hypothetical protein n=1 Tax=Atopobium fossor TaxID=39487 RepID=UPI00040EE6BB|nr:hypothetical protein [Atopobium fossor]